MDIGEELKHFVRKNKKALYLKFADPNEYPSVQSPSSFFMAGSPGAGKTEYSVSFIEKIVAKEPERKIVRLDH